MKLISLLCCFVYAVSSLDAQLISIGLPAKDVDWKVSKRESIPELEEQFSTSFGIPISRATYAKAIHQENLRKGTLFIVYPETDIIMSRIPILNGEAEGYAYYKSPDGSRLSGGMYRDGQLHGKVLHINHKIGGTDCPAYQADRVDLDAVEACQAYHKSEKRDTIEYTFLSFLDGKPTGKWATITLLGDTSVTYTDFDGEGAYSSIQHIGNLSNYESIFRNYNVVESKVNVEIIPDPRALKELDVMPMFIGNCSELLKDANKNLHKRKKAKACSDESMTAFIYQNLKYPKSAYDLGITGTSRITFVVEKDGSISNVRPIGYVSKSIDAEAVRVIESMPKWKPGTREGVPVRVQFDLPIRFLL